MRSWQWNLLHYIAAVMVGMLIQMHAWFWVPMALVAGLLNAKTLRRKRDETCMELSLYKDDMLMTMMGYWRDRAEEEANGAK